MKALKIRYYAFIVIGIISFVTNFTIQSGEYVTYRTKAIIDCFGDAFVLVALILWAIAITGLMQIANKNTKSNQWKQ